MVATSGALPSKVTLTPKHDGGYDSWHPIWEQWTGEFDCLLDGLLPDGTPIDERGTIYIYIYTYMNDVIHAILSRHQILHLVAWRRP